MREKILKLLKTGHYKKIQLQKMFDEDIDNVLDELENKKLITKNKDYYRITNIKTGTIYKVNGKYYINVNKKDILINDKYLNGAKENDLVNVDCDMLSKTGIVVDILVKKNNHLVGKITSCNNRLCIMDRNKVIYIDGIYNIGDIVTYKKISSINDKEYNGKVIKVYEKCNYIKALQDKYLIKDEISNEVLEEVKLVPQEVLEEDLINRVDLTYDTTFTIDGNDSKDFDDAVSVKVLNNGNYLLKVSIADVAHYVKKDSAIDKLAKDRSTSNYPINQVIPMLPFELSNGICSLNPNVLRLARTFEMEFDNTGKMLKYNTYKSVIKSNARLTYEKVNALFDGTSTDYINYKNELNDMLKLARILRKRRMNNYALDLEMGDSKCIFENDVVVDVIEKNRGEAEKLIEEFMLATGIYTALYLTNKNIPLPYRYHGNMTQEKFEEMLKQFKNLKIYNLPKNTSNKEMSQFVNSLRGNSNHDIYYMMILKSLAKARYDSENKGHYALNTKYIVQVTSPIRRYLDLVIHRILDDVENNKKFDSKFTDYLNELCQYASIKEINSDSFEKEVEDIYKSLYMQDKIGNNYNGRITEVDDNGVYIKLYNGIKCAINEQYKLDKGNIYINGTIYNIGDNIDVIIDKVDVTNRLVKVKLYK